MAKFRIDLSNPRTYARLLKEGRGKGRNEAYKAGLTVQDLSSRGESNRMQGWHSGNRLMHFLSQLERDFCYTVQWDPAVVDIREQFPLHLATTRQIADQMGLKHPTSPETGLPFPMTTDFLITKSVEGKEFDLARNVKRYSDIELKGAKHPKRVRRNWEKFLIEQEYWKRLGVALKWVTEKDFSLVLANNVRFVHTFYHLQSLSPLTQHDVETMGAFLFPRAIKGTEPLAALCLDCDKHFSLLQGKSLLVVKHLIARRRWKVDFNVPFDPSHPVTLCN
jgi:hypothetical protein